MYAHLTSSELLKARNATEFLTDHAELLRLDTVIAAKLSTLHADLTAEAEDRKVVTELPRRAMGLSGFTPAHSDRQ